MFSFYCITKRYMGTNRFRLFQATNETKTKTTNKAGTVAFAFSKKDTYKIKTVYKDKIIKALETEEKSEFNEHHSFFHFNTSLSTLKKRESNSLIKFHKH